MRPALPSGGAPAASPTARATAFVEEALRWLPTLTDREEFASDTDLAEITPGLSKLRRAKILLADDNADMRAYVARLLSVRHDVEAVATGKPRLRLRSNGARISS